MLEAIYLLSRGKSFRSTKTNKLIQQQQGKFTVFASLSDKNTIGLERITNKTRFLLNGDKVVSINQIAPHIPTQLITTKSYRYFTDGPKVRRNFLNWGLYYFDPSFLSSWKENQKALAQRNAGLKQRGGIKHIDPWTELYLQTALQINQNYVSYIEELQPLFSRLIHSFLPNISLELSYNPGWPKDEPLNEILAKNQDADYRLGFTQYGIHRADLEITYNKSTALHFLSQGQLKLASYALILAQGQLLDQKTQNTPIYLIDDLSAELDDEKQALVISSIAKLKSQCFITAIDPSHLTSLTNAYSTELFSINEGKLNNAGTLTY